MRGVMLQATFVRTAGDRDRVYVTRSDGTELSWSFPTYGDRIPHDLVHLVVEARFGLRSGFWGRVDGGTDPARINAEANRVGGKDKYASFGSDRAELLMAEALANAPWRLKGATHEQILQAVSEECRRLGVPTPERFFACATDVQSTLARLGERWRALVPKGAVNATFRTEAPEASVIEAVA